LKCGPLESVAQVRWTLAADSGRRAGRSGGHKFVTDLADAAHILLIGMR
jgi:hypothetical protein